jgi:tripartite-type tricarboxylate transporter receptor subunit TctC
MSETLERPAAKSATSIAGAVALVAAALAAPPASAADFYAGKTLTFIVGTDASGGFSIYGRLIARHLARYIPGGPTVVVKNMPGAGGSTAASFLFQQAPRDGTTIASLTPNSISAKLMGEGQLPYDPTKFSYIAGAERGTRLCMSWYKSKIATLDDALKERATIGMTSTGSPTAEYAAWVKHTTGAKFDLVSGYRGPGDLFLAMERGEIDGVCGLDWTALKSQQPEWLKEKKLNLLLQANIEPDPELTARGVPQPWKYIKNDIDRRAAELMVGFQQAFGKAYLAPPAVPAEQLTILRAAFAGVLKDKELLADAAKLRVEIAPQSGEQIEKAVDDLYAAPKEVAERLRAIVVP